MSKKIYIGEDNLINIKNAMAGKNISHSTFMSEDKPPYEKDEYEIGGEGGNNDFFHVNENVYQELINTAIKFRPNEFKKWAVIIPSKPGIMPNYFEKKSRAVEFKKWYGEGVIVDLDKYNNLNESYGFSRNVDLSEVGRVNYTWDFDEYYYFEWLEDNEYADNDDVRLQYIKEGNVEFELDFCDNQTYHSMGSDNVYYDDLEDLFGEKMAETILKNCIEDGSGYFDTEELYYDDNFDINSPSELDDMAMKVLRHGEYYKDCRGFILSNGVVVYTDMEHNEVTRIPGISDKFQFIELGNIRVLDHSIDIGKEPTRQQYDVLKQVLKEYSGEELYLDIFSNGSEIGVQYHSCNPNYVLGEITRFYSEGIKPQGETFYEGKKIIMPENKLIAIKENLENEVEANEVSLDSFKKQKELAPKIWNGDKLNSRVRLKLLDIADDFWESTNIGWVKPKNIVLMGSICNYNWSKYSDIDLHLQVDFSEVDEKKDFVQEYFNGKKNEWNKEHSSLKIFDYPVELYVEDIDANTNSGGIYDLEENNWIKKPSKDGIKPIGLNKYSIKDKSAEIMTDIDDLYDAFKKTDDDAKLRKIGKKAHHILDYVKAMRKGGLSRGGESDKDNIVYKVLRRTGYMDTLWNLSSQLYDKLNSIEESTIKESSDIFSYAKERFGVTNDIRECGYILPDGSMLDFSGRHMVTGDTSHLRGRRGVDHRDIGDLQWDKELKVRTDVNVNMSDFIRSGAIRIHCSNTWSSINLFKKPTKQQANVLIRLIQYSKGNVTVEIGDGDNSYEYAEWDDANPRRVINDIIRYFDGETIKLVGNVVENKIIKEYFNKHCHLNEEYVADGNASHNPFKQRWKHEREVLINYLLNYGELMTSKENGKQYKVLFDEMLSNRIGFNYCLCIQWNPLTMEPGNVIYVRAYDKFTKRLFKPQYDYRGKDNLDGTYDDVV